MQRWSFWWVVIRTQVWHPCPLILDRKLDWKNSHERGGEEGARVEGRRGKIRSQRGSAKESKWGVKREDTSLWMPSSLTTMVYDGMLSLGFYGKKIFIMNKSLAALRSPVRSCNPGSLLCPTSTAMQASSGQVGRPRDGAGECGAPWNREQWWLLSSGCFEGHLSALPFLHLHSEETDEARGRMLFLLQLHALGVVPSPGEEVRWAFKRVEGSTLGSTFEDCQVGSAESPSRICSALEAGAEREGSEQWQTLLGWLAFSQGQRLIHLLSSNILFLLYFSPPFLCFAYWSWSTHWLY